MEHTIVHRQGSNYGAPQGKRLCLFVDDMNVLKTHESGTQITNEVKSRPSDRNDIDLLYDTKLLLTQMKEIAPVFKLWAFQRV